MSGNAGDAVRTAFYEPKLYGKLSTANNPTRNRLMLLERFYLSLLTEMSVSRFKWDGLPDAIDQRFLELGLLNRGLMVMFKEDELYNDYVAMRASSIGDLNIYDNPVNYTVIGGTGSLYLNKTLDEDECVPVWANILRRPQMPDLQLWANRLANMDRTVEISAENARQTKLIGVPESIRLSAMNVVKRMKEGSAEVFGTPELLELAKNFVTMDLESHPAKLMNMLISKAKMWNEIMTFMGINNSNQDKKERLVSDEVAANDEQVDLTKRMHLLTRQQAAEAMNEKFDLNVTVDFITTDTMTNSSGDEVIGANAVPQPDKGTGFGGVS